MAFHLTSHILAVSLLTSCVIQAGPIDLADTTYALKDLSLITTVASLNRAVETFGGSFQQAVELYRENSEDLRALRKLPDLMNEIKNEIADLKSPENKVITTKISTQENNWKEALAIVADQLNIKNLVKSYDKSKDWRSLRSGLESVLDHDSKAYTQLQKISWAESYAPWQIAFEGHTELVYVLVFAGRGINMKDGANDNLLHGAVAGGQAELVNLLLDNGAGIESRNKWGNAPLALACKYHQLAVARLLWKRGAEVDGINYEEKWAGLHRAAENGNVEIAKFMVQEASASTTLKDRNGKTPYDVAKQKGHTAVVEFLSGYPH